MGKLIFAAVLIIGGLGMQIPMPGRPTGEK